jgi:hypothetical protein
MIPFGLINQKLAPGIAVEVSVPSMSEDFVPVNALVPPVTRLITFDIVPPLDGSVNVTLSWVRLGDWLGDRMLNTLKL